MLAQHDWFGHNFLKCSGLPVARWYHVFCSERCAAFTMQHFTDFTRLAPFRYLTLKQTDRENWNLSAFAGSLSLSPKSSEESASKK